MDVKSETTSLFDQLKRAIGPEWQAYTEHEFVRRLGDGTLPPSAFQDYLVQDYLFLVQFARASALAAYKSRTLADIAEASGTLQVILYETELHRRFAARWGIAEDELEKEPEKQVTVAYTRYVLDCGMAGDLLDLHVALAPCAVGYAEIGAALGPGGQDDHPYAEWIAQYAGEEFQEAARAAIARLDALAGDTISERRFAELVRVFRAATRLEADFWQQALDAAD
ncbi:MAG: thiaminase II [Arachnia sp.]